MGRLGRGEGGSRGNKGSATNMEITWLMDLVAVIKSTCVFLCMCSNDIRAVALLGLLGKRQTLSLLLMGDVVIDRKWDAPDGESKR